MTSKTLHMSHARAGSASPTRKLNGLEFMAGIAHDLKTPLATIATSADLLAEERDNATSDHLIKVIQRQAARLNLMIIELSQQLRDQPNSVELHRTFFDVVELVTATVDDLSPTESPHLLNVQVPPHAVQSYGDPNKLRRVIENLVRNALKYSPENSTVIVRVSADAPGAVLLEVEDEGAGIPEALRSRVFEPFVRLEDRPDQGQGLGLHVVKLLTEAHGGRAWVQSSPLGGARFCVLLPTGSDRAD